MNSTAGSLLHGSLAGGTLAAQLGVPGVLALVAVALASLWLLSPADDWHRLPGPPAPSWLLGHLSKINTPRIHRFFQDSCKLYGANGMFRLRLLTKKIVVLSDPNLIQEVVSRKSDFPKVPEVYDAVDELFSKTGHRNLFNTHSYDEWKLVRKGTAPAFSPDNIRKAFPTLRSVVSEVCDGLAARVAAGQEDVDVADASMRVTLDLIGQQGYGHDFKARTFQPVELLEAVPPLLGEYTLRATNPLYLLKMRLFPFLPAARMFKKNAETCHKWWDILMASVRATDLEAAERAGDTSLRVCLARLPVSDELLRPQVAVYLIGGFETTAHSIAWTLYELASNPGVQARVAAELAGCELLGPAARQLEFADLAELSFLNCVLKEAMRLHPVASTGTIRSAPRDITLSGFRLSKGTWLWAPFITILTSAANWERADDFWPERWEQQAGAAKAAEAGSGPAPTAVGHASNPSKTYLPFSDGPRDCIGQNLALMEARAVLAMLVGRFELSVAPCMGSREDVRAAEVMKLTLQCSKGVHLRLELRE